MEKGGMKSFRIHLGIINNIRRKILYIMIKMIEQMKIRKDGLSFSASILSYNGVNPHPGTDYLLLLSI